MMSPHRHDPAVQNKNTRAFRLSRTAFAGQLLCMSMQMAMAQTPAPPQAQQAQQAPTTSQPAEPSASNAQPAQPAQEGPAQLDTVVVRSRNRLERVQDVPLSVSAVAGTDLERLLANDVSAITKRAANINWNPGNPRQFSLAIRGIGKQGQTDAQDPSVGIIVDGVNYAYNPLASSVDFTDVDTVEVTRGPQGTLLGKNTSLGVINITTRRPSFTPDGSFQFSYGQRQTLYGTATFGGPVVDDLIAWRGTISGTKGRGDVVNRYNDDITYANRDRLAGRLKVLITPTADFNALLSFDAQPKSGEASNGRSFNLDTPKRYANGSTNNRGTDAFTRLNRDWFTNQSDYRYEADYLGNAGRRAVDYDNYNPIVTGTNGASAELNWTLGDHTVTSISAYRDYYFDARNDEGTPFDVSKNGGGLVNYKQLSQELRLTSKQGGFVDYQAGLFAIRTDIDHSTRTGWGADAGAWFATADKTNEPGQYSVLNTDPAGRALMQDSLNRLYKRVEAKYENTSNAIFGQANWHLSDPLTLTTGLRITREDRQTRNTSRIADQGAGAGLNPAAINGVNLGGFESNKNTGELITPSTATATQPANTADQLALADRVAQRYFNKTYANLSGAERVQIANAKNLRLATVGSLWRPVQAEGFKKTQPAFVLSPSYKFSPAVTGYLSWQYGEKAGIAQIVNGVSYPTEAERTHSYEIGAKSVLFDKTLILNTDIFLTRIKNYQQSVQVVDDYTTALNISNGVTPTTAYTAYTGNVPKVEAYGLEIDGAYGGIRHTTLRFSGAYNIARYLDFPNSAQPSENGYTGAPKYRDISGEILPGASKFTFNIGADYRLPVFTDKVFHVSFNTAYNSSFNSDNALSSYGKVKGSSRTDLSIGMGQRAGTKLDVSLIVKNAFDDDTEQSRTWNSWTPAEPRWVGVAISGKL
jgi:iron complex outermembrane receptor protein